MLCIIRKQAVSRVLFPQCCKRRGLHACGHSPQTAATVAPRTARVAIIYLGGMSPYRSSNLPECVTGRHSALLSGLAPGGVYLAAASPQRWCALTAPLHPCLCSVGSGCSCNRYVHAVITRRELPIQPSAVYMSVALSLGSLPLGVTQHPALRSSDFPPARPFGTAPAIASLTSECLLQHSQPALGKPQSLDF